MSFEPRVLPPDNLSDTLFDLVLKPHAIKPKRGGLVATFFLDERDSMNLLQRKVVDDLSRDLHEISIQVRWSEFRPAGSCRGSPLQQWVSRDGVRRDDIAPLVDDYFHGHGS